MKKESSNKEKKHSRPAKEEYVNPFQPVSTEPDECWWHVRKLLLFCL